MDRKSQRQPDLQKLFKEATGRSAIDKSGIYTQEYVKALERRILKSHDQYNDLIALLKHDIRQNK